MTSTIDPVQAVVDAFRPVDHEEDAELELLEGRVPPEIDGALIRNGPGKLDVHGMPLRHPFDGDGMVSRFDFSEGRVRYRNRWVRTRELREEAAAGRPLYRNFGTNLPGGFWKNAFRMRFKNTANTSVVHHGGRLLALWEAGLPHELDPESLETRGRFDFDGELTAALPRLTRLFVTEAPFSAHPKIDPASGRLYNFGLSIAPRPELLFYTVDPAGRLGRSRRIALRRASFMHDFTITERHAIFFATPIRFDVPGALSGLRAPVESIRRAPREKTEIIVVPLDGGPERRLEAPDGFFIFHFFNAHETAEGALVVDGCRMADFPGGTVDLRDKEAVRGARFDSAFPTRWTLEGDRVRAERLSDVPMELPFVDPRRVGRRARYGWATARTEDHDAPLYSGLARLDFVTRATVTRDLSPDLPGEPVFIPRDPEASATDDDLDGWLATVVYRAHSGRSELWLTSPDDLSTQARLALPHHLPPGFHGRFAPR